MKNMTKLKIAKYGAIISGVITLIIGLSGVIIKIILKLILGMNISLNESSSVAIIGGADGPTAVFITSKVPYSSKYIFMAVFFIITIVCSFIWRRIAKSNY